VIAVTRPRFRTSQSPATHPRRSHTRRGPLRHVPFEARRRLVCPPGQPRDEPLQTLRTETP
jgi:hypothetical protein